MNRALFGFVSSALLITGYAGAQDVKDVQVSLTSADAGQTQDSECDIAWLKYVSANPLNHLEKYQTTVESGTDALQMVSQVSVTKLVMESNADQVFVAEETDFLFPGPLTVKSHNETTTRLQFTLACGDNPDQGSLHPVGKIHPIDSGKQTITVPAGTFECDYQKYSTAEPRSSTHEKIVETWVTTINGASVTVKTITVIPGERTTVEMMNWR